METDHEGLHQQLEKQGDELEERRDSLKRDTDEGRQDIRSKVSDSNVPGAQDEQEDVIHGMDAVEEDGPEDTERDEAQPDAGSDSESDSGEGGGSRGAGYRE